MALAFAGIAGAFAPGGPASARGGRHAAMILDANSGAVLHAEDADEQRHPASLTKMMTLYLTFETILTGRLSMTDKIKISQEAANQAPSKLELEPGEEITVSDAVRALITKSANDVAVALAEKVGGSEKNFVRLMNTRARDLGMMKTNFENASGLPNKDQVTTARDMITLGLRLQDDFPNFYPLFATRAFSFNRGTYRNHNTMLNTFQGIDGIKTGYTSASGFNLVSSVRRGGRHVVGAVFGGSSAASRNGEMRNLLTRALTRASTVKTRKPAPSLIAKLKSAPKLAERPKAKDQPADAPKFKVAEAPAAAAQPQVKPFAAAKAVPDKTAPAAAPVAKAAAVAAPIAKPAAKPAVAPAAAAEPAPAVQPAPVDEPQAQADPVEMALSAPAPVDVFKVKRVMVAPRQGPKAPPPNADETTDMAPEENPSQSASAGSISVAPPPVTDAGDGVLTLASTGAADVPADTVIPKTVVVADAAPARRPSALDDRIAMLGASDVTPPPAAIVTPVVAPVAAKPVAAKPAPVRAAPLLLPHAHRPQHPLNAAARRRLCRPKLASCRTRHLPDCRQPSRNAWLRFSRRQRQPQRHRLVVLKFRLALTAPSTKPSAP